MQTNRSSPGVAFAPFEFRIVLYAVVRTLRFGIYLRHHRPSRTRSPSFEVNLAAGPELLLLEQGGELCPEGVASGQTLLLCFKL